MFVTKGIWEKFGFFDKGNGTLGVRNPPKFRDGADEARWWEQKSDALYDFAFEHGLKGKRPARSAAPTSARL